MVEKLETLHEERSLDLGTALEAFRSMSERFPDEYRLYELPHIATTIVAPLLKTDLQGWAVLDAPFKHKEAFAQWRTVLFLQGEYRVAIQYCAGWQLKRQSRHCNNLALHWRAVLFFSRRVQGCHCGRQLKVLILWQP